MKKINVFVLLIFYHLSHAQQPGLDPTFGNEGVMVAEHSALNIFGFNNVLLQPNNKIVASGFGIARFNENGSWDNSYGTNGVAMADFNGPIAVQNDNRLIVGNRLSTGGEIIRLNENGTIDNSFGNNGSVTIFNVTPIKIKIQTDQKILIIGNYSPDSALRAVVINRYLADGKIDSSFAVNGQMIDTSQWTTSIYNVIDACLSSTGDIFVEVSGFVPSSRYFAIKYTSNGSRDISYGTNGIGHMWNFFQSKSMDIQADGKVVLSGSVGHISPDNLNFAVARYDTNGNADTSYYYYTNEWVGLEKGIVLYPIPDSKLSYCNAIKVKPDGKIILGGRTKSLSTNETDFTIMQIQSNGTPDNVFGNSSLLKTDIQDSDNSLDGIVLQPDGKILAAGHSDICGTCSQRTIVRYLPNGKTGISNPLPVASTVQLYPNPAVDKLHFYYPQGVKMQSIMLYDASGRLLYQWRNNVSEINIGNKTKGVYLLRFVTQHGDVVSRPFVIKQ